MRRRKGWEKGRRYLRWSRYEGCENKRNANIYGEKVFLIWVLYIYIYIYFKFLLCIFIYLLAWGLSCGTGLVP